MSAQPKPYVRRLLVAMDTGRCAVADLTVAIELAALIGTELHGLFVEDSDLIGLARLPFAREVGGRSGQDRPIELESVESWLQRRSQRMAQELERAAKLRNIMVSHQIARGKMLPQALEQGTRGDVVLLRSPAPAQSFPASSARALPGPVMVWYDDGPAALASCDIAMHLARRFGSGLLVGFPASRFGSEALLRERLEAVLGQVPGQVRWYALADARVESIIAIARTARATQLILTGDGPLASSEILQRIFTALRAGVILVR